MKKRLAHVVVLLTLLGTTAWLPENAIVVNTLEDLADPPPGVVTLRSALAQADDGQIIRFARQLDGGTIELSIVGAEHSVLKGEVMGIREEESGPVSYLVGYFERDYGRSALYARKDVVIDAASLRSGITLRWAGGEQDPARILAVYGNLTMTNVALTGGWSVAEPLPQDEAREYEQLSTRARGAGLAVWGAARLAHCRIYDNHCKRDPSVPARSRDAGAFGGGIYADIVELEDCVVAGNSVSASGVSGGGVFSVGGAEADEWVSSIDRSAITGNRIRGIFAYGGGVYSDGGGIGKRNTLALRNITVARNLVEPLPGLPAFMYGIGYWRGGGIYMSNGYLEIQGGTIVENEVYGKPRTDSLDRANLAGGVAATIGNAHAVEEMRIGHSVIAGNTVREVDPSAPAEGAAPASEASYAHDLFTGSLLHFKSRGYNRFGVVDFSQILAPVGEPTWRTLARRHFPKVGDEEGVALADVLELDGGVARSGSIVSAGVDAGEPTVLHYQPKGSALDQVPTAPYSIEEIYAEYNIPAGVPNDFLPILLDRLERYYALGDGFAEGFTADFEAFLASVDADDDTEGVQPYADPDGNPILTLGDTLWFGPAVTWPQFLANHPYVHFWHRLDRALLDASIPGLGSEVLGDADWAALFPPGPLGEGEDPAIVMTVEAISVSGIAAAEVDQLGNPRPGNELGDIGAIEITPPPIPAPLTRDQQACVNELGKSGERVNKAQLRENERCLMDFQNGKLAPMTFDGCLTAYRSSSVQRAGERTELRGRRKCDSLDAPPPFAHADAASVNRAAVDGALELSYAIFGGPPVLDADLATKADDRSVARCQLELIRRAGKLEHTVVAELNKAKRKSLRDATVDGAEALEARLWAVLADNDRISRAENRLASAVERKCTAVQGIPGEIFAGECGAAASQLRDVADCAIAAARCEACLKINAFDALELDCDRAGYALDNQSCP